MILLSNIKFVFSGSEDDEEALKSAANEILRSAEPRDESLVCYIL